MKRFGKHKPVLFLLAVVVVQFIALTALLAVENKPDLSNQTISAQTTEYDVMPQWLEAAAPEPELPQPKQQEEKKVPPADALSAPEILSSNHLIAHGMGQLDGVTTLNCLEAFQHYYEQGVRVFEVDLRLTSDMQVVLRHDWRAGWQDGVSERDIPTLEEFLDKPLLEEEYTPLSFRDLLLLMEEYPDICIITDSKFTEAEIVSAQFKAMVGQAKELDLVWVLDRMVVQVYNQLMFKVVDNIYPFPHYIYTLYTEGFNRTEESLREKAAFCQENGIGGITMWDSWWKAEFAPVLEEYGLAAYVHTVNDADAACDFLDSGISAVYTDSLIPADVAGEPAAEGEATHGTD